MNTELTLIRQMEKTLPMVLINNILSYRPAHHLTPLVEEAMEQMLEDVFCGDADREEDEFDGQTFTGLTCCAEDTGCFKTLLWNIVEDGEDWSGYCDRVRQDYQQIYLEYGVDGIWNEDMEEILELNKQKRKIEEILCNIRALTFN